MCSRILKIGEHRKLVISLNIYFRAIYHFYAGKTSLLFPFAENSLQSYFMFTKLALVPLYLVCAAAHVKKINDGKITVPFT